MKTNRVEYNDRLYRWFGDVDYEILHRWFEPSADAPTLFAVVKSEGDLLFMRVYNTNGRLQVHVDQRILIESI